MLVQTTWPGCLKALPERLSHGWIESIAKEGALVLNAWWTWPWQDWREGGVGELSCQELLHMSIQAYHRAFENIGTILKIKKKLGQN